jgi:hypothetical protein
VLTAKLVWTTPLFVVFLKMWKKNSSKNLRRKRR